MKNSTFFILISTLLFASCKQHQIQIANTASIELPGRFFSKIISDSFSISVMLPNGYDPKGKQNYPVAYILDANLYFDIMSTTISKYSEVGLAPNVILVGIGYKDFAEMDSLRTRDDTWPVALPEYEMSTSGGADKFLKFISEELTPHIDKQYKTDTTNRILMGHSLGGYFVAYALQQQLAGKSKYFTSYLAASPSMHYNNYYLLEGLQHLSTQLSSNKVKAYFTFGGLEDEEDDEPGMMKVKELSTRLEKLFSEKLSGSVEFKTDIFSNLGHMETPFPSFTKGLQWTMSNEQ